MKRFICFFIAAAVLVCLSSCSSNSKEVDFPVSFYYSSKSISYNTSDGVIASEIREYKGYENNLPGLLAMYLSGPLSKDLVSPFPKGTALISLKVHDDEVHILLSEEFAKLTGMDLTIACTCISMTMFGVTDCSSVALQAQNTLLNGVEILRFTPNDMILLDDYVPPTES